MFEFLFNTKDEIEKITDVDEDINCCLNFKYTVYQNVYKYYVISLYATTAESIVFTVACNCIVTEKDQKSTSEYHEDFSECNKAVKKFFELCNQYKKKISKNL